MGTVELERKAYAELLEWKSRGGTTAILIDGARRVGKSHLAVSFASNEYKSHVLIDFSRAGDDVKDTFIHDANDLNLFFQKLMLLTGTELHRRESVLIFDEVQFFPRAREMIKHLVADGRYDYIETGSLISIRQNVKDILIPSEEEILRLNPLDFEEFLWALGDRSSVPLLRGFYEKRMPLGENIHRRMMTQFRKYMLVGGMPQSVLAYLESGSFADADRVKRRILSLYREDVARFANGYRGKVLSVFDGIPSQLSRREKRFKLSSLEKGARSRGYEDSFMWLEDGRLINQCFNSTDPSVGLRMHLDPSHKCYMADTGLLVTHSVDVSAVTEESVYRSILLEKAGINQGAFMENVVAQELVATGHRLFFYARNDREDSRNTMEIDFLIVQDGKVCPVEVKSSRLTHSSLTKFKEKFGKRVGQPYVLCTRDLFERDGILFLPVYMTMFLRGVGADGCVPLLQHDPERLTARTRRPAGSRSPGSDASRP